MDLEQFIGTLSVEERQFHKDLIEECRSRTERTRKVCEGCYRSLADLSLKLGPKEQEQDLQFCNNDVAESAINRWRLNVTIGI